MPQISDLCIRFTTGQDEPIRFAEPAEKPPFPDKAGKPKRRPSRRAQWKVDWQEFCALRGRRLETTRAMQWAILCDECGFPLGSKHTPDCLWEFHPEHERYVRRRDDTEEGGIR